MVNHSALCRSIKYDYINLLTWTILKKIQILNGCKTFAFKYMLSYKRFCRSVKRKKKRNSQPEQGQPMQQIRNLFCTCNSGVARFQLQHQCHFWRMSSTAINQIRVIHEAMDGCKNLKDSLKACFENVIIS